MSEMVDRVAKVLSIADGMHPDAFSNDEDESPMWTLYIDDARDAIKAMRTPTEEMVNYGANQFPSLPLMWRAMIDEALK